MNQLLKPPLFFLICFFSATQMGLAVAKEQTNKEKDWKREGVQWGASPIFNYSTDNGLKIGIFAQRFNYGFKNIRPYESLTGYHLQWATQGPRGAAIFYERLKLTQWDLRLHTSAFAFDNTHSGYFGIGDSTTFNSAQVDGYYSYRSQTLIVSNQIRKKIENYDWDLRFGFEQGFYQLRPSSANSLYQTDFGSEIKLTYHTQFLFGVVREKRNYEMIPSKGYYFSASALYAPEFLGTDRSWLRQNYDFRFYYPFIADRWLWIATQALYKTSTENAPIPQKASLGGAFLRGYSASRYLTNHTLTLRAELRSILIRWMLFDMPLKGGLGVFADTGKAGDDLGRMFSNNFLFGWGISLFGSYFTDDYIGHADFGFSKEGTTLHLALGHIF